MNVESNISHTKLHTANSGFSEFSLSEDILGALKALDYHYPTEIQAQVIPIALQGKNIVGKSQTGSGKTAAFAIPLCQMVTWEENAPQALVLEPTRELTVQVKEEIFHIGRKKRLKVPAIFGGLPIDKQIITLKQKAHIIVGTPGRIMDHVRRGSLKLEQIRYLVIDEADLMLDMGFWEEVTEIINLLPPNKSIMLFSATMKENVRELVGTAMEDYVPIFLEGNTETASEVEESVCEVKQEDKYKTLLQILIRENPKECMIFCGTREMVNVLFQKLKRDRIRCGMIHGDMEQRDRLRAIEDFRNGSFPYLIATDVAARGVDFEHVTHVINYDFPMGRELYVHRIGRTGRNGKTGKAISILGPEEQKMKKMVEEYTKEIIPLYRLEPMDAQSEKRFWGKQKEKPVFKERKGAALQKHITKLSIGGGKKSKIRTVDIVGTICSIEGITPEDIGIIDIRDSLTYVEILHGKGTMVLDILQAKPMKGKVRKVKKTRV